MHLHKDEAWHVFKTFIDFVVTPYDIIFVYYCNLTFIINISLFMRKREGEYVYLLAINIYTYMYMYSDVFVLKTSVHLTSVCKLCLQSQKCVCA